MIRAGIVGGAGYTGGELIRILLGHPQVSIGFVSSRSQQGKAVSAIHHDLLGDTDLHFSAEVDFNTDVLFLCMGHGESKRFLQQNEIPDSVHIIDLSRDFRLNSPEKRSFVYGLPEAFRQRIREADHIANPGCFATSIQLALLPLASAKRLQNEVHISGITGSTGAGQQLTATAHFSWRSSNISVYKAFKHQHLAEIRQTLSYLQQDTIKPLRFLPFRGNFTRGILSAVYTVSSLGLDEAYALYESYYANHPFVYLSRGNVDVKQVVNTNKAFLHLEKEEGMLLIISVIDNLIKGAAGQAVQNMNLMFGLDEESGLHLKPVGF